MLHETRIAFIGAGNMAEAMISGLLKNSLIAPGRIIASGPRSERANELREKFHIETTKDNRVATENADIVCLCVKPSIMPGVFQELKGGIDPSTLIISIAAGITIKSIEEGLMHNNIVRAMPNTPARITEGITMWTHRQCISAEQKEQATVLLGSFGDEIAVENEGYIDMATALSGTGPAYVFLFVEALVEVGVHIGLPRYIAEKLVFKTVRGAVDYAAFSEKHIAALRNEVTSPAGTTAEAMYNLERDGFRTAISNAVRGAYEKSCQLGNKK